EGPSPGGGRMTIELELAEFTRRGGAVVGVVHALDGEQLLHVDRLNLTRGDQRAAFIRAVRARANGQAPAPERLEEALLGLLAQAEADLAEGGAPPATGPDEERIEDYVRSPAGFAVVRMREPFGVPVAQRIRLTNFTARITEEIAT